MCAKPISPTKLHRRHGPRFPWTWSVALYFSRIDRIFEKAVWATAKLYKGGLGGSGSSLGTGKREMTFVFVEKNQVEAFIRHVRPLYRAKIKMRKRPTEAALKRTIKSILIADYKYTE